MRAKLTPTFTSGKMKFMFHTVSDICDQMIKHLNENGKSVEVEMKDVLSRFTTDVIGNVAFGLDVNSTKDPDSRFIKMLKKFQHAPLSRICKIIFVTIFPGFAKSLGIMITDKEVSEFYLSSVKETVEYREANNVKRNDFLSLLVEIKNHGKINGDAGEVVGKLTLEEIAAQAFLFFLAG